MLRAVPFPDPGRLVVVWETNPRLPGAGDGGVAAELFMIGSRAIGYSATSARSAGGA